MSIRRKDKIEYELELRDLETLSTEEILEKYGIPSRRIKSRISNLRLKIATYDFPSPHDWFEVNGNRIHEIALHIEVHGVLETCKHFRIFYTVNNIIIEYKRAHPELFKIRKYNTIPDITSAVIGLFEKYNDAGKVMSVLFDELHLENLDRAPKYKIREYARTILEKYIGEIQHVKSKIFKDMHCDEITRDFVMDVIEYNRVNGYEACREKYFIDNNSRKINNGMYKLCYKLNIDTDLWHVPIRDSKYNMQKEKVLEMVDYYYKHGSDALIEKYNLTYKMHVGQIVYNWKRKFGLVEMYRGRCAPRSKKGS